MLPDAETVIFGSPLVDVLVVEARDGLSGSSGLLSPGGVGGVTVVRGASREAFEGVLGITIGFGPLWLLVVEGVS